ncbi:zinc finger, C2H2 type [Opisthorchis viverrini]|uniref:Zinc finger, C2H2 type n=1 Tax=Opisthorchis viverrini TaxID=6198 RepID=A0A1S8WQ26_OPIVI|nr:zinc finger, C2H2 type [Opisthorchis viverrini]
MGANPMAAIVAAACASSAAICMFGVQPDGVTPASADKLDPTNDAKKKAGCSDHTGRLAGEFEWPEIRDLVLDEWKFWRLDKDIPDKAQMEKNLAEATKRTTVAAQMPRFKVTPQTQKIHEDSNSPTEDEDDDEFPGDEFVEQTVKQTDEDLSSSSQDLTSSLSALAGVTPSGCTPNMQIAALLAQAAATMAAMGSGTNLPLPQAMQPLIAPLGLSLPSLPKPVPEPMMINAKTAVKYKPVTPISGPSLPLNRSAQLPRMPMGILIAKSRPRAWTVQKPVPKRQIPTRISAPNLGTQRSVQQTVSQSASLLPAKKSVPSTMEQPSPKSKPPRASPVPNVPLSSTVCPPKVSLDVTFSTSKPDQKSLTKTKPPDVPCESGSQPPKTSFDKNQLELSALTSKAEQVSLQNKTAITDSQPTTVSVNTVKPEVSSTLKMDKNSEPSNRKLTSGAKLEAESNGTFERGHSRMITKQPSTEVGLIPLLTPPKTEETRAQSKRRSVPEEVVQCSICNKSLLRSSLPEHMDKHNNSGRFSCPVCPKKFSRSSAREKHIRIHTGEKPFRCPHCPKAYRQQVHLNEHLRSHSGERPFVCRLCGFALASKSLLTRHIRTHGVRKKPGEVPELWFKSDAPKETVLGLAAEVGRVLGQKDGKQNRTGKSKSRSSGNGGTEAKTQLPVDLAKLSRKYLCDACPAGFPTAQTLRSHRLITHGGTFPHKCSECGEAFATVRIRRAHALAKHPYICPYCSIAMSQRRPGVLEAHIREVHPEKAKPEPTRPTALPTPRPPLTSGSEVSTRQLRSATKRSSLTDDSLQIPKWKRFRPDKAESDTSSEEEAEEDSQSSEKFSDHSEYVADGDSESATSDKTGSKVADYQAEVERTEELAHLDEDTGNCEKAASEKSSIGVGVTLTPALFAKENPESTGGRNRPALFFSVQNIAPPILSESNEDRGVSLPPLVAPLSSVSSHIDITTCHTSTTAVHSLSCFASRSEQIQPDDAVIASQCPSAETPVEDANPFRSSHTPDTSQNVNTVICATPDNDSLAAHTIEQLETLEKEYELTQISPDITGPDGKSTELCSDKLYDITETTRSSPVLNLLNPPPSSVGDTAECSVSCSDNLQNNSYSILAEQSSPKHGAEFDDSYSCTNTNGICIESKDNTSIPNAVIYRTSTVSREPDLKKVLDTVHDHVKYIDSTLAESPHSPASNGGTPGIHVTASDNFAIRYPPECDEKTHYSICNPSVMGCDSSIPIHDQLPQTFKQSTDVITSRELCSNSPTWILSLVE